MTKISSALPDGESYNGLRLIAAAMEERPTVPHVVIVVLDTKSVTVETDTGRKEATARIRWIEPIIEDVEHATRMLQRAQETRTGKSVLPLDLEDDLAVILAGIDPHTGEVAANDGPQP